VQLSHSFIKGYLTLTWIR